MKKLGLLLLLSVATFSCSKKNNGTGEGGAPNSGPSFAEYEAMSTSSDPATGGTSIRGTVRIEKLSETRAKVTFTTEGQATQSVEEFDFTPMSQEQIKELVADCSNFGTSESVEIETPRGRYKTCHLIQDGEEYWYGEVPFMLVKRIGNEFVEGQNRSISMTLKDYRW